MFPGFTTKFPECELGGGQLLQGSGHCDDGSGEPASNHCSSFYKCNGVREPPKLPIAEQIRLSKTLREKDQLEFSIFEFQRRLDAVHGNLVRVKEEIQMLSQEQVILQQSLEATDDSEEISRISLEKVEKHKRLIAMISQEDSLLEELEATQKSLSLANIEQQTFALEMNQKIDEIYRIHTTRKDFEFGCRIERDATIHRNTFKNLKGQIHQFFDFLEQECSQEDASLNPPKSKIGKSALENLRKFRKTTLGKIDAKKKEVATQEELRKARQKHNLVTLKRELDEQREMVVAANKIRRERALEKELALAQQRQEIIAAGGNPYILEKIAEMERAERIAAKKKVKEETEVHVPWKDNEPDPGAEQRKLKLRQELDQVWAAKAKEKRLKAKQLEAEYFENLKIGGSGNAAQNCAGEEVIQDWSFLENEPETPQFNFLLAQDQKPSTAKPKSSKKLTFDLEDGQTEDGKSLKFNYVLPKSPPRTAIPGTDLFKATPEEVVFKDFDLGKSYRKRVIISNRSGQRLRFFLRELVDLKPRSADLDLSADQEPSITDVVKVAFDIPPPLSPGLTHEFFVTFSPKTFESLAGEIRFESPVGGFSVPVKCIQKQFDPALSSAWLTFPNTIVGTSSTVKVKVINRGALPGSIVSMKQVDPNDCLPPRVKFCDLELSGTEVDEDKDRPWRNSKSARKKQNRETEMKTCEENDEESVQEASLEVDADEEGEDMFSSAFSIYALDPAQRLTAFGELTLEAMFNPGVPGDHSIFYEISFDNPEICHLKLQLDGTSISNPFLADPLNVNFNICRIDFHYQQPIVLHNLSKFRGKVTAKVPPILKSFVEVVPKTAQSSPGVPNLFTVKFNPRSELFRVASIRQVFDFETRILDFSVLFFFDDFPFPTPGPLISTFQAILDEPKIELSIVMIDTYMDFGICTTTETVRKQVTLTNVASVTQDFGFVELPEWLVVQPNYGFGTLLPGESRDFDVLLSPSPGLVGKHSASLKLRTLDKKDCVVGVKFIGKLPTTTLRYSHITFPVTCIGSSASAVTEVYMKSTKTKHQVSAQHHLRAASILGLPSMATFEFLINEQFPIEITPSMGTIEPGKGQKVLVTFKADLSPESIRKHYPVLLEQKFEENRANIVIELARIGELLSQSQPVTTSSSMTVLDGSGDAIESTQQKKKPKSRAKTPMNSPASSRKSPRTGRAGIGTSRSQPDDKNRKSTKVLGPSIVSNFDDLQLMISDGTVTIPLTNRKGLELRQEFLEYALTATLNPTPFFSDKTGIDYDKTRRALLNEVTMVTNTYKVPCRVTVADGREELLFLMLKCPAQRPDLVILEGSDMMTFDPLPVGSSNVKELNLHNTSVGLLTLKMDTVNQFGPFSRVNALRPLAPNLVFTLRIKFAPTTEGEFEETVRIFGGESVIFVTLKGECRAGGASFTN